MFERAYIGLKDKNGKPIHEGDLVRLVFFDGEIDNEIERVYYDVATARFGTTMVDTDMGATTDFERAESTEWIVIGSIYDELSPKKRYKKQELINRAIAICGKLAELIEEQ